VLKLFFLELEALNLESSTATTSLPKRSHSLYRATNCLNIRFMASLRTSTAATSSSASISELRTRSIAASLTWATVARAKVTS
jgi:hypothetical protein